MPKVTKVNSFTTQPLNHLTTQLLSSFILAQRPCVFIERIKAPRDINDPAKTIGKNLRLPSLSPFLAFNKAPCRKLQGIKRNCAEANPPLLYELRRGHLAIHPCSRVFWRRRIKNPLSGLPDNGLSRYSQQH